MRIDDLSYETRGDVNCSKGSGDNEETFFFRTIRERDRGGEHLLLEDRGKWWMYSPPPRPVDIPVAKVHEEFKADRVHGCGRENVKEFAWVTLERSFDDAPLPYTGTAEALVMTSHRGVREVWMCAPLMRGDGDVFYSPHYPAANLPRKSVTLKQGLAAGGSLAGWLCGAMALLFGAAALSGIALPMQLMWWLGPLAVAMRAFTTRQSQMDHVLRLVGGVFFLHFATHLIDHHFAAELEDREGLLFESARLSIVLFFLFGLSKLQPKIYFAILDGSTTGGGCAWSVFTVGILIASFSEEDNFFRWFDWYAGMLPWSILWLLGLAYAIWFAYDDYRQVPLDLKGFRSLLYKTADTLSQTAGVACQKSKRLAQWADDLDDALGISADPLVASLAELGPDFVGWREQAKKLGELNPDALSAERRKALEADLAIIASDYRGLVAWLDADRSVRGELLSLRRSPFLETLDP